MHVKPRKLLALIGLYLAIAEGISFWTARSLNPIHVYAGSSLLAKVIVTLMLALAIVGIFGLVQILLLRSMVRVATGCSPDDARCCGCGNPLLAFIGSHGRLVMCRKCRRLWHKSCFYRDNRNGPGQLARLSPCLMCQKEAEDWKRPDFEDS